MTSPVDYKGLKAEALALKDEKLIQLRLIKAQVHHLTQKKKALRYEGKATGSTNIKLSEAIDKRNVLQQEIEALKVKVGWLNGQMKIEKPLEVYFVDVCKRDLDPETFKYLLSEARKARLSLVGPPE